MNEEDFKKLLDESLDSIRRDLQSVKSTQEEHTDLFEKRVLPPLVEIETTVKSYKDAYQVNKANIERLDDRLSKFEDDAGVIIPSELAIQR